MFKKSNGGYKRIGFGTSYKKRYFCITTQHFFYAKAKNKSPLFKFPISEITVKKLPDNYSMKNVCFLKIFYKLIYIQFLIQKNFKCFRCFK